VFGADVGAVLRHPLGDQLAKEVEMLLEHWQRETGVLGAVENDVVKKGGEARNGKAWKDEYYISNTRSKGNSHSRQH
jgi:hypothetical protein